MKMRNLSIGIFLKNILIIALVLLGFISIKEIFVKIFYISIVVAVFLYLRINLCPFCTNYDRKCNIGWDFLSKNIFKKCKLENKEKFKRSIKIARIYWIFLILFPILLNYYYLFKGDDCSLNYITLITILGFFLTYIHFRDCKYCDMKEVCLGKKDIKPIIQSSFIIIFQIPIIFIYSMYYEPNNIVIKKIAGICQLYNEKIVFITDLHIKNNIFLNYNKVVDIICKIKPNITILGGDMIDDRKMLKYYENFIAEISKCSNKIIAVFGNWEYTENLIDSLESIYKKYNVILLRNNYIKLDNGLCIFGVDLSYYNTPVAIDINTYLKTRLEKNCKNVIVVSHYPIELKKIARIGIKNICLGLAGHTHGGQIRIPIINKPFLLPNYSGGLSYGMYLVNNTRIYVSSGVGTHKFLPLRFNSKPEIIVIK